MRVKNITVTVSVRVSAMVWVSLVSFVISNNVSGIECRHLPNIVGTIAEWLLIRQPELYSADGDT